MTLTDVRDLAGVEDRLNGDTVFLDVVLGDVSGLFSPLAMDRDVRF